MPEISIINIKRDKETPYLYIGRENRFLDLPGSKWANPFPMKNEGQRLEVLSKYFFYLIGNPDLLASLHELDGQTLGCYCVPKTCHGNVIIAVYNYFVLGQDYPNWVRELVEMGITRGEIANQKLAKRS